ncbi:MAG: hypothetical protein EOP04_03295 [Proteobacteria bacterium]|nr:MAG: hypothetical protein EOP04_03295 [Pseudomonadota bacterium]
MHPTQEIELISQIRQIEIDLFGESFLTTKAAVGVIKQGSAQNKLGNRDWLVNEITKKVEQIRKSQALGAQLRNMNREPRPGPKLTNQVKKVIASPPAIVPIELKPLECRHTITFNFSELPEAQEMEKYTRVAFLVGGFDYEVHVGRNKYRELKRLADQGASFIAEVSGQIGSETPKGFLVPNGDLKVVSKHYGKKITDHRIRPTI